MLSEAWFIRALELRDIAVYLPSSRPSFKEDDLWLCAASFHTSNSSCICDALPECTQLRGIDMNRNFDFFIFLFLNIRELRINVGLTESSNVLLFSENKEYIQTMADIFWFSILLIKPWLSFWGSGATFNYVIKPLTKHVFLSSWIVTDCPILSAKKIITEIRIREVKKFSAYAMLVCQVAHRCGWCPITGNFQSKAGPGPGQPDLGVVSLFIAGTQDGFIQPYSDSSNLRLGLGISQEQLFMSQCYALCPSSCDSAVWNCYFWIKEDSKKKMQ